MQNLDAERRTTRITAALITATLTAAALLATGCDETEGVGHAHADLPTAPSMSLEAAIAEGDDDAVRAHIDAGTPLDTPNAFGDTPLSVAAVLGRASAAAALVNAGAGLEVKNHAGATPLFNAAFFCHPEVVRVLIDAGADTGTADAMGTPIRMVMETPWEQIEPIYAAVYGAIGLPLDAERIETTRPRIAEMLR
jgi:hypothetical protein